MSDDKDVKSCKHCFLRRLQSLLERSRRFLVAMAVSSLFNDAIQRKCRHSYENKRLLDVDKMSKRKRPMKTTGETETRFSGTQSIMI